LAAGQLSWPTIAWAVEVTVGACLGGYFALAHTIHRQGMAA
jgi:hypothetical protein